MGRGVDWKLRNSDLLLLTGIPIYCALLYSTPLPFSGRLLEFFVINLLELVGAAYLAALLVIGLKALWIARTSGRKVLADPRVKSELLQPYFSWSYLLVSLKRGVAIFGVIYLFLHLKHVILYINQANYDLFFWDLDRVLHFGYQPNILMLQVLGGDPFTEVVFDWLYIKYFDYKILTSVFFLLELRGRRLSDSYFSAYAALWLVGGLAYLAFPADGPCYAFLTKHAIGESEYGSQHVFNFPLIANLPTAYEQTFANAKTPTAKFYQERLWVDRQRFIGGKAMPSAFYGIAAMPSLHVAAVTMLAIMLWQVSKVVGLLAIAFAVLTFLGSIFLQWHYAVDGYVGLFIGGGCAILALRIPRLFSRSTLDDYNQFKSLRTLRDEVVAEQVVARQVEPYQEEARPAA